MAILDSFGGIPCVPWLNALSLMDMAIHSSIFCFPAAVRGSQLRFEFCRLGFSLGGRDSGH